MKGRRRLTLWSNLLPVEVSKQCGKVRYLLEVASSEGVQNRYRLKEVDVAAVAAGVGCCGGVAPASPSCCCCCCGGCCPSVWIVARASFHCRGSRRLNTTSARS